ncbi:MAG: amidohydrolase, partial [SAR202 cluster bacterium]|nr:amidohydrolase [SAR202 cluster bacterium]
MTTDRQAWLALTAEDVIDPDLPICDPHHHFWDRPSSRYILEDLLGDTGSGHNITETVFVECSSEYLNDGPEALKV